MVRCDWYQTEGVVWIEVFNPAQGANQDVELVGKRRVKVMMKPSEHSPNTQEFNKEWLLYAAVKDLTRVESKERKLVMCFEKQEAGIWPKLEGEETVIATEVAKEAGPTYPSSAKQPRDWGRLEAELVHEEEEATGESGEKETDLEVFFKKIYANASDDAKRAMNKSYVESGGTVLSTNWEEVSKNKTPSA